MLARLKRISIRHLADRKHYRRKRDWFCSIYNRILIHTDMPLPGRGWIYKFSPPGTFATLSIRLATTDWYVMEEIFLNDEYEIALKRFGNQLATILDLGTNVGMSVHLWQTRWPQANIVAVEPDRANLDAARKNVIDASKVIFVNACVAAKSGTVSLDRSAGEFAFRMTDTAAITFERIPAFSVSDLCEKTGFHGSIDFLKCDIEGAEAELFATCSDWIDRVRFFSIETHAPYSPKKLFSDFSNAGVRILWHLTVDKGDLSVIFGELVPSNANAMR